MEVGQLDFALDNIGAWGGVISIEQLFHRDAQRFRGGLVFKAHRLCVSLNSRLQSNKEEEEKDVTCTKVTMDDASRPPIHRQHQHSRDSGFGVQGSGFRVQGLGISV